MTLQEHQQRALAHLQQLIAIPSFSREEDKTAALLADILTKSGVQPKRIKNNVWAVGEDFDEGKPTILLNSHHDTVRQVASWKKNPFDPVIEMGKLNGLGSNDAGAALVCLLETFLYFNNRERSYNLVFLASAEEEISGRDGVELALKELPHVDLGIVGEPTEMNMAVAEKGLMVLDCTASGKSGHAARDEGENALYKAVEDIGKIRLMQFEKISPLLGPVKLTVTQIEAGTQHNVVPDTCRYVVDVRTNEYYDNEVLHGLIAKELKAKVEARSYRLNSSGIDLQHPIVKKAAGMGLDLYGSPTLSDQALMPFETIKMGPGKSERSHTANEYILLEELDRGIEIYIDLLTDLTIDKK